MMLYAFNLGADYPVYTKQIPAKQDPVSGKWLIPAYATDIELIPVKEGHQRYFKDGAWHYVADNVGTHYWDADGTKHTITELSEDVPEGARLEAPNQQPLAASAGAKPDTIAALDEHPQGHRHSTKKASFLSKIKWPKRST